MMGANAFITGPAPTIADIAAYGEIGQCAPEYCDLLPLDELPEIAAWVQRMKALPHHDKMMQMVPNEKVFSIVRSAAAKL